MRSLIISHNGRFQNGQVPATIEAALADRRNILWLDVQDPTDEDVATLREQFGFHPLAIEDAIRAHERPKVDAYGVPGDLDHDGTTDLWEEPVASPSAAAGASAPVGPDASAPQIPVAGPGLDAPAGETPETSVLIALDPTPAAVISVDENLVESGYYFVVFYTATYNPQEDHIEPRPVSLFIGANYLVTVHTGPERHIADTLARWRAPKSPLGHRIGSLVHALLDAMVDDYFPLMDQVADRVEDLEDTIFTHFDEGSIETIFRLKKDLLAMRRVVAPERDVLNVLLRRQLPIFSSEDVAYLQDVYDHIVRVTDNIDTYRDLLSSALDSYLSLQGNRLNQIMKVLTIGSIILMADALVTGFYGQNFHFFPELSWPTGSFWALGLMAVITLGLVVYFRRKKWL
ncbi:MAG: magnesium/cobalt transporter CorA [Chloroflexi bacterium]|nr:magnesium/cobalt transporter CorA [Chloroflexota bacterium]